MNLIQIYEKLMNILKFEVFRIPIAKRTKKYRLKLPGIVLTADSISQ